MYLNISLIQCCRYLCGNRCICNPLIFAVADALFLTNVSATCFSLNLQMLFSLSIMYNCICILPFLGFKDTSFANFASTSHIFDNVKMLPSKITHPQLALSMLCGYFTSKFCIFNPRKSTIADTFHTISFAFYLLHNLSQYITYKKIYALMCYPLMESEQEFLYQFFVRNVLPPNEVNSKRKTF